MDGGDAVLVGELAHKTKPADTASETSSLPEQKGFRGFVLLDTQDFTGEPKNHYLFPVGDNVGDVSEVDEVLPSYTTFPTISLVVSRIILIFVAE